MELAELLKLGVASPDLDRSIVKGALMNDLELLATAELPSVPTQVLGLFLDDKQMIFMTYRRGCPPRHAWDGRESYPADDERRALCRAVSSASISPSPVATKSGLTLYRVNPHDKSAWANTAYVFDSRGNRYSVEHHQAMLSLWHEVEKARALLQLREIV